MALWGCRSQGGSNFIADPDEPSRFVTWNSNGAWRVGDRYHQRRRRHASGILAHSFAHHFHLSKFACPCGLPFWTQSDGHGLQRYCCQECIASVGTSHGPHCSMHY